MKEDDLGREIAEARRHFDHVCAEVRSDLHRFCTRMTGSPWEGEDVLQDVLVLAFYRLPEVRERGSLRSWIFRIAHNKCIDFLRRRDPCDALEEEHEAEAAGSVEESLDQKQRAEQVLTQVVTQLPAKERACIVLKDVLDSSLEETAHITGSSVGAVKAALHRARAKLENPVQRPGAPRSLSAPERSLIERYLAAFNSRDWDGVRALLSDGARLEVVHRSEGPFTEAPYLVNYAALAWNWKLALAHVDGVESIVHFRETQGVWSPRSVVQLAIESGEITKIRDYFHVDDLLRHCAVT